MHNSFVIKVSDLLKTPGSTDTIDFENLYSDIVPGLTEQGISGHIFLQSLNEDEILVEISDISAQIKDTSDISGKEFTREIFCSLYSVKFVRNFSDEQDETRQVFDEEFPLHEKSETINLEEVLKQAILLQEPITKIAPDEKDDHENDEDDIFEHYDPQQESQLGGRVTFQKGK